VSTSAPSSSSPPSPTPSTSTSAAPVATGRTTKIGAGFLGLVLPLIALIGLVGLVLSGGLTQLGGRRRR
jgi:hypothetical protein